MNVLRALHAPGISGSVRIRSVIKSMKTTLTSQYGLRMPNSCHPACRRMSRNSLGHDVLWAVSRMLVVFRLLVPVGTRVSVSVGIIHDPADAHADQIHQ